MILQELSAWFGPGGTTRCKARIQRSQAYEEPQLAEEDRSRTDRRNKSGKSEAARANPGQGSPPTDLQPLVISRRSDGPQCRIGSLYTLRCAQDRQHSKRHSPAR